MTPSEKSNTGQWPPRDDDEACDLIDAARGEPSRYLDTAARAMAHRRKLTLTVRVACVDIEATPATLPEAGGGCTLWIRHWRGTPLEETTAYTLTADEANQLVAVIGDVITSNLFRQPDSSRSRARAS